MVASPAFLPTQQKFRYVPEWDDFLDLFPHRGSYLWAEHPTAGDRPDWQTETRHLLSDRLIIQGAYLYGVRFGQLTHYLMIDIDHGSQAHPSRDPYAIGRIIDALEPLGLVSCVPVRSSYSDGIHLYFPFAHGQKSWAIAQAAESLLKSAGLKLEKGQVELFPNPRRCTGRDYNGHRLPLQQGSYLLDTNMEPVLSSRGEFVRRWRLAENRNTLTEEALSLTLKQFSRQAPKKLRFSAQKFLNDLNADIEAGWTSSGQTNYILGRIAQREYVFFHALYGGSPLSGERLAARICEVAEDLPGYKQYCHHQYEMFDRCMEFSRSIEHSGYYPYGGNVELKVVRSDPKDNSWNKQQATDARQRLQNALTDLMAKCTLPSGIRKLLYAIKGYGISAGTFYKNRDLWEGKKDLKPAHSNMIRPTSGETEQSENLKPAPRAMIRPTDPISLYTADPDVPPKGDDPDLALKAVGGRGGLSTSTNEPPLEPPLVGIEFIRYTLDQIKQRRRQPPPPSSTSSLPPPDENWFNQWRSEGTA
jgi:hypothetical protein